MSFWSINSTSIGNDQVFVNNTYKDSNGNNKLSTITTSNPGGYTFLNRNSSDPIVKNLAFAVQNDGKITYIISGSNTQYNSIQEIANSRQPGYTAQTTLQIKNELLKNLRTSADKYNQANPDSPVGPSVAAPTPTPDTTTVPLDPSTNQRISDLTKGIESGASDQTIKGKLAKIAARYPEDIDSKSQDIIIFRLLEIVGRQFTTDEEKSDKTKDFSFGSKQLKELSGSVVLPIQPSITDSNGVEWGGGNLDPLSAYAGRASLNITTGDDIGTSVANELKRAGGKFKEAFGSYSTFLNIYFAQEAIGATGLLSRATGAVLNPNLELLFSGPTLRTFSFTFKMSPRSKEEAKMVKDIIFFFKAGMAVRKANTGVFLKSPYVFKIEYQSANNLHQSLNRIKECALLNCDVDYTPDGSYMTFNDEEKTFPMTSYQLTLRFSELDPIYNDDYVDDHPIGF